jgi:hypothetical protein
MTSFTCSVLLVCGLQDEGRHSFLCEEERHGPLNLQGGRWHSVVRALVTALDFMGAGSQATAWMSGV